MPLFYHFYTPNTSKLIGPKSTLWYPLFDKLLVYDIIKKDLKNNADELYTQKEEAEMSETTRMATAVTIWILCGIVAKIWMNAMYKSKIMPPKPLDTVECVGMGVCSLIVAMIYYTIAAFTGQPRKKNVVVPKTVAPAIDLRESDVGMSCNDYSLLVIAGPATADLPTTVRERLVAHEQSCSYHQSAQWHQSAVGSPATQEMEAAALELVEKLKREGA